MRSLVIGTLCLLFIGASCFKRPPTASELIRAYNESGQERFTNGNYEGAREDFGEALALDSTHAEANVGMGWVLIVLEHTDLGSIAGYFNRATDNTNWQVDAWAGLAIIRLIQQRYSEADSLVGLVLSADSSWVLLYEDRIDWRDMLVIQAQSRFFQALYTEAWSALEPLVAGTSYETIDPDISSTWIVNGTTFALFEEALAEVIMIMTEIYRQE